MHRSYGLAALLPLLLLAGCPTKAKTDSDGGMSSNDGAKGGGAGGAGGTAGHGGAVGTGGGGGVTHDGSTDDGSNSDGATTPATLQITTPSGLTYTKGTLLITVVASGGRAPTSISLVLDDGSSIATITGPSPYKYSWDTTMVMEGPHRLVAESTSGSPAVMSNLVTVWVDRTAPKIAAMQPLPGATNVVLRAPIVVGFSEAMDSSATAGIGLLLNGTPIASTSTLTNSGFNASIVINDPTSFALPGTFSVTFASTMTDLAGNALVPPTPAWSWTVPDFITYAPIAGTGQAISNPVLTINKMFQPVVALAQLFVSSSGSQESNALHVETAPDLQTWNDFGRPSPNGDESYGFSMSLGAGDNPVVAWAEKGNKVYVSTWNGSAWGTSSTATDPAADPSALVSSPILRLDPSGLPVLAWMEKAPSSFQSIFLTHLTSGGASTGVPGAISVATGTTSLDMILDPQGNPVIAWRNGPLTDVNIFRGAETTTPTVTVIADPALGLDAMSDPLLIAGTTGYGVFAFSGGSWTLAPPMQIQIDGNAQSPKLKTDPAHNPVVGWLESGKFTYERWTGTAWDSRAGIFGDAQASQYFDMVVDSRGTVWVMGCNPSRAVVIMSNY